MPHPDFDRLLTGYLDGDLTDAEREQLAEAIERDPAAARQWEELLRLETLLTAAGQVTQVVRGPWFAWRWVAAAAAAIVVVGIASLFWTQRPVTLTGPVVHELANGARVELDDASRAIVHRETVALQEGGGTFHVVKGRGVFQVVTTVGKITVLGTEFRVELRPEHTTEGVEDMQGRTVLAMTVAVMAGSVQVDVGQRSYTLGVGQSMVFAEEKAAPTEPKPPRVGEGERRQNVARYTGMIAVVTDTSLTVTMGGGDGGKPVREETVTLTPDTQVRVETEEMEEVAGEGGQLRQRPRMAAGKIGDLQAGQRVSIHAREGVATEIVVLRKPVKRSGGEG